MHHTNRHDVIEAGEDIQDVLGVHVTEENGQKVATIKAILDPRKDFLAVKDLFLHFTNGINHKLLGPFSPAESPNDLLSVPVPAPTVEVSSEAPVASNEATQPLADISKTQPSTTTQEATTAKMSTDNSTSADTEELPAVSDPGKKGK